MRPRILSRYVAGQFLLPFLYAVALFSIIILIGDIFDHINAFMRSEAPFGVILSYLGFQVPYWTVRTLPAATLLAALFCMSSLMRKGEWIAAQATGFSPGQVLRPVLGCALAVSFGAFLLQETVFPFCHRNADQTYREKIKGEPEQRRYKFENVDITAARDEYLHARQLNIREGKMEGVIWTVMGRRGPLRQRLAKRGGWSASLKAWVFFDGVERIFSENLRTIETPFKRWVSPLKTVPQDLEFGRYEPDSKNLAQTLRYIHRRKSLGLSARHAQTAAHMKLAYPLSNFIIAALALVVALSLGGVGKVLSSVLAMLIGFFYWWLVSLSEAFGFAGRLPPEFSAWIPNGIFGLLAVILGIRTLR